MPHDAQKSRRKSQLVAKAMMAKVHRDTVVSSWTTAQLWSIIDQALDESRHTREMMGHTDRGCEVVRAQLALRELKMRGTQLQLPL